MEGIAWVKQLVLRICGYCSSSPKSDSVLPWLWNRLCKGMMMGHKRRNFNKGSLTDSSDPGDSSSLPTLPGLSSSKRLVKFLSGFVYAGISRKGELRQREQSWTWGLLSCGLWAWIEQVAKRRKLEGCHHSFDCLLIHENLNFFAPAWLFCHDEVTPLKLWLRVNPSTLKLSRWNVFVASTMKASE